MLYSYFLFVIFSRLSGFSPFMGDNDQETLKNVAKGEWDFEEEAFNDISDEALDWIEKILVVEKE